MARKGRRRRKLQVGEDDATGANASRGTEPSANQEAWCKILSYLLKPIVRRRAGFPVLRVELELELIKSHMAQKPVLRGEVGARALRVRSDVRGHRQVRLCKALGCGRCVGLGQNGRILFISVEQLSLNVADDSAKTLSVLGNTRGPFRTPLQNYS